MGSVQRRWYGNDRDFDAFGVRAEAGHRFTRGITAHARASWHDRDYRRDFLDGPVVDASLSGSWVVLPTVRAEGAAGWGRERAEAKRWRHERWWVRAGASVLLPWGFTAGGSGELRWTDYEGNWFPHTDGRGAGGPHPLAQGLCAPPSLQPVRLQPAGCAGARGAQDQRPALRLQALRRRAALRAPVLGRLPYIPVTHEMGTSTDEELVDASFMSEPPGGSMATNHVFVDYENVKADNFDLLADRQFKAMIFLGANHAKIPVDLVLKVQELHAAEYIRISGNGPNAADFHIAFYIRRLSKEEPGSQFHIVSKDKGFDPLVQHLRSLKIKASRAGDLSKLVRIPVPGKDKDTINEIPKNLSRRGASRPRKVSTLAGTIGPLFNGALDERKVQSLIDRLRHQKHIVLNGEKVSYRLGE